MKTLFDWESSKHVAKLRKNTVRRPPDPQNLQEHRGRLVVSLYGADWMLRTARMDIRADSGVAHWIRHRNLDKLLEYDGASSIVRYVAGTNQVVRDYSADTRFPLHNLPPLIKPPDHAWDPLEQLGWPLDRPSTVLPTKLMERVRWAYRFLAPEDDLGLRIDRDGTACVNSDGLGPVYQSMPGWPAMRLRSEHLACLIKLIQSESHNKRSGVNFKPANSIQITKATIGTSQTPYWMFYADPTPAFLAVRCRQETTPASFDVSGWRHRLLVIKQEHLIDVCRRVVRPWGASTVTLAVDSSAGKHALRIGTPDFAGALASAPIECVIESLPLLRVAQGAFCKAVSAVTSPSKRIGFYLNKDQTRLRLASVNLTELPGYGTGPFDNHISRIAEIGIQKIELGVTEPVPVPGVISAETH
ncbi:MAG: hypothetical protein ACE37H_03585 [Phycisphaeraceae bacterium]